jgi:PAS domain-containing protein
MTPVRGCKVREPRRRQMAWRVHKRRGVGMGDVRRETGDELRERLREFLIRRVRVGLVICIIVYLLFAVQVLLRAGVAPALAVDISLMRAGCAAIFAAGLLALRRPTGRRAAIAVALISIAVVAGSSALSGVLLPQDMALVPMTFVVQAMFTAALIPWGLGAQLISVVIQFLALAGATAAVDGTFTGLTDPVHLLALVSLGISICIAYEFKRYRLDLEQREAERDRTADALRASERRFRTLSAASPIGIFQTDPTGACLYVNRRWHEITGLSEEASLGDRWTAAVHLDDRPRLLAAWRSAAIRGASRKKSAS